MGNERTGMFRFGQGILIGHWVTLRRFLITFVRDWKTGRFFRRRGGGSMRVDLFRAPEKPPIIEQDERTEGLFTVEYPDERLPVRERARVLPVLIYDEDDGNVRCTNCTICAKVCPPQCIWMEQARAPGGEPVAYPADFQIDMDVCMNCGLCAEYCPFDAIKMDQIFELANQERHQSHIYGLTDLLVSSQYYARTHPDAWESREEQDERAKVTKRKDQRRKKAEPAPEAGEPTTESAEAAPSNP